MAQVHAFETPEKVPDTRANDTFEVTSTIAHDGSASSSFEEALISRDVSPLPQLSDYDREKLSGEILATIVNWHGRIIITLIEWARIFIEEEPQMLTHSSTIVEAYPSSEKMCEEFGRGVSAICRIMSDDRLEVVYDWAVKLKQEWYSAMPYAHLRQEVRYSDFLDLMYSEAMAIMEEGTGEFRSNEDLKVVEEVFGFAKEDVDADQEDEDWDGETLRGDAMSTEG